MGAGVSGLNQTRVGSERRCLRRSSHPAEPGEGRAGPGKLNEVFLSARCRSDTRETRLSFAARWRPSERAARARLEGLPAGARAGPRLLGLSPVALLEPFNASPERHGARCNSIFSMTAGKGLG